MLRRKPSAVEVLLLVGIVALLAGIAMPIVQRYRETHEYPCYKRMNRLGLACFLYSTEHGGNYPENIEDVAQYVPDPELFVCPRSGDTPARGATTQELISELAVSPRPQSLAPGQRGKGHLSYIFLGRGMTQQSPPRAILLYERLENHRDEGINVVYLDGSSQFIERVEAAKLIAELQSGHNPPRAEKLK